MQHNPRRRKKEDSHQNHERWLVSYADLITLLFAFFVVMFAISQADLVKFQKTAEGMRKAFHTAELTGVIKKEDAKKLQPVSQVSVTPKTSQAPAEKEMSLVEVRNEIAEVITDSASTATLNGSEDAATEAIQMNQDEEGLHLEFSVRDVFQPGDSHFHKDYGPLIEKVGLTLKKANKSVRIEGYADGVEDIGKFDSIFDLSAARAAGVAKLWVEKLKWDPSRISIAGFGRAKPTKDNRTKLGQGMNRRVEIVVISSKTKTN